MCGILFPVLCCSGTGTLRSLLGMSFSCKGHHHSSVKRSAQCFEKMSKVDHNAQTGHQCIHLLHCSQTCSGCTCPSEPITAYTLLHRSARHSILQELSHWWTPICWCSTKGEPDLVSLVCFKHTAQAMAHSRPILPGKESKKLTSQLNPRSHVESSPLRNTMIRSHH